MHPHILGNAIPPCRLAAAFLLILGRTFFYRRLVVGGMLITESAAISFRIWTFDRAVDPDIDRYLKLNHLKRSASCMSSYQVLAPAKANFFTSIQIVVQLGSYDRHFDARKCGFYDNNVCSQGARWQKSRDSKRGENPARGCRQKSCSLLCVGDFSKKGLELPGTTMDSHNSSI